MALNVFPAELGPVGLHVLPSETTFQAEADAALARFQANYDNLERRVRRGDLPLERARAQAEAAAAQLRNTLRRRVADFCPVPRIFLERLIAACDARAQAREESSLEALQRETNRLLRLFLVEQQLQSRAAEFEAQTYHRPPGGGRAAAAPTLERLLALHQTAGHAGDEAALEWSRRQLELIRGRMLETDSQDQIDRACDRPGHANLRQVARHLEALRDRDTDGREAFVTGALADRDPNACVAAFLLARQAPEPAGLRWVRLVVSGLDAFPDAALALLRTLEAQARGAAVEYARVQAERAIAVAEAQTHFPGLEPDAEDAAGPEPLGPGPAGGAAARGPHSDSRAGQFHESVSLGYIV